MKTTEAQQLAIELMGKHNLLEDGWTFRFDNAKRRFGCCYHKKKLITISKPLTKLNNSSEVKDTILHEIAHALTGIGAGHNWLWKATARLVGANPSRCYDSTVVVKPKHKWVGTCPSKHEIKRFKRMKLSCSKCHPTFNTDYMFVWTEA